MLGKSSVRVVRQHPGNEPRGDEEQVNLTERLHDVYGGKQRLRALSEHVGALLPEGAKVLDVGCGDGALDARIQQRRPDLEIAGIDVLVRSQARIPVTSFDGRTIPHPEGMPACCGAGRSMKTWNFGSRPTAMYGGWPRMRDSWRRSWISARG